MAILKEPKTIPTYEKVEQVALLCDACGKRSVGCYDWSKNDFDVAEITIEHKWGDSYPEGGSGKKFIADVCPDCFSSKVIPALASVGIHGRTEEWDY